MVYNDELSEKIDSHCVDSSVHSFRHKTTIRIRLSVACTKYAVEMRKEELGHGSGKIGRWTNLSFTSIKNEPVSRFSDLTDTMHVAL